MRYLLSIGSNAPHAPQLMERATLWLAQHSTPLTSSGIYASKALSGGHDYLNMVAEIDSPLSVTELIAATKDFERTCGRSPQSKSRGCIEMDIDIIRADNVILRPVEYTRPYFLTGLRLLASPGQ